jgi:hypothetical protein
MSAYTQEPLDFKERLEEVANLKPQTKTLNMQRLASEVKKSLTPLQSGSLAAALLRAGSGLPAVLCRDESVLTISQRNSILALACCNDVHTLAAFFEEEAGTGNGVWNEEDKL